LPCGACGHTPAALARATPLPLAGPKSRAALCARAIGSEPMGPLKGIKVVDMTTVL